MDPFEKLLRGTVDALSYRDWHFRVEKDGIGLWFLQVEFSATDTVTGKLERCSGRKWRFGRWLVMHRSIGRNVRALADDQCRAD
jgi:hypothetical protein